MKKNIVIILSVILISLVITTLYQTFATDSGVSNSDNVYNISLTDSNIVSVPAYNSKTILYQIVNTNKGTVKYGVAYNADTDINVFVYDNSSDSHTGLFDYGEYKYVKLRLYNDTGSEKEVSLKTILGYENGGDLILPSGYELVDDTYISTNYLKYSAPSGSSAAADTNFLASTLPLARNSIEKINVTSKQPDSSSLGVQDVSVNQNGSIMLWYTDSDSNDLYEVYLTTDDEKLHLTGGLQYIFYNLTNLKELNTETFDTSLVTSMYSMFRECKSLVNLDVSSFDTSNSIGMGYMFFNCLSLTYLDVSNFNTSKVTNMRYMFADCKVLTNLDVSNFDTYNVTTMEHMFYGCSKLTKLDVSNWDVSNNTSFLYIFHGCASIEELDVSNFYAPKVTTTSRMFSSMYSLKKLKTVDAEKGTRFETKIVSDIHSMFRDCSKLMSIDLSGLYTSNLTNVEATFHGCSSLTSVDIRNIDFSSVTKFTSMFNKSDPTSVNITINSSQQTWFNTKFPAYTNLTLVNS